MDATESPRSGRKRYALLLPTLGAAAIPKCPFCVLALAQVLNAVGIDAAAYDKALLPVIGVLLAAPAFWLVRLVSGGTRRITAVLLTTGTALYLTARTQDWPVAWQLVCLSPYALGVFWARPSKICRCASQKRLSGE